MNQAEKLAFLLAYLQRLTALKEVGGQCNVEINRVLQVIDDEIA